MNANGISTRTVRAPTTLARAAKTRSSAVVLSTHVRSVRFDQQAGIGATDAPETGNPL